MRIGQIPPVLDLERDPEGSRAAGCRQPLERRSPQRDPGREQVRGARHDGRRTAAGRTAGAGADIGRRQAGPQHDRALEARRRVLRVHLRDVAGAASALEPEHVIVGRRRRAPDRIDRAIAAEDGLHVARRVVIRLGDDRRRPRGDEPGREVVDALLRLVEGPLGQVRLRQAAGVAQVVEQDDRVLRELDRRLDPALPEVLMRGVVPAGARVEPEAVLRGPIERVAVAARPAVAVAHVDDKRGALEGRSDGRPCRVRGIDLGDVGRVPTGHGGRRASLAAEPFGHRPDRSHDDHDPGDGRGGGHGRHRSRRREDASDEQRRKYRTEPPHHRGHSLRKAGGQRMPGRSLKPYSRRRISPLCRRYRCVTAPKSTVAARVVTRRPGRRPSRTFGRETERKPRVRRSGRCSG